MTTDTHAVATTTPQPSQVAAPAQADSSMNMLSIIARAASDPSVDVAKMSALLDMQIKISGIQAEAAFNAAMSACQQEMPRVWKDKKGENNRYATLEGVDKVARPVYSKHGFSLSFGGEEVKDDMVTVHCRLSHCAPGATVGHHADYKLSGQVDIAGPKGNATKTGIQGMGSTASYLRRYLTCMIFNISTTDDNDGAGVPKPEKMLTDEHRDIILKKLDAAGKTAAGLCQWAKVKSLTEIPDSKFDAIIARLNAPQQA